MGRIIGFVLLVRVCCCPVLSMTNAAPPEQVDTPQPVPIDELAPKLDRKELTIKFMVTRLEGVAQLSKAGQAPSFVIETESGKSSNRLDVWVEGELANVLDRLQMGFLQENQLKVGTTIVAKGKLRVHTMDPHLYFLSLTRWQNFRILPSPERK